MKRRIIILTVLVISTALVSVWILIAYGEYELWNCPECLREGNKGNYCGTCGWPAPWKPPIIVNQPESLNVKAGERIVFSASVQGATSFQWQYSVGAGWKSPAGAKWITNQDDECMTLTVTEASESFSCRLVIWNANGVTYSEEVRADVIPASAIYHRTAPIIQTQPKGTKAKIGESVTLSAQVVNATGYQWQYKLRKEKKWRDLMEDFTWASGTQTNTLTIKLSISNVIYEYRLVAQNARGEVHSNAVMISKE